MPKPPSQQAKTKTVPSQAAVEALANELADRPYGVTQVEPVQEKPAQPVKRKPISISLPPEMIERLEDLALKNKRAGTGPKSVSALVLDALYNYELLIHN